MPCAAAGRWSLRVALQVYDFALPLLVLHAFHFQTGAALRHWLRICPRRQFTVRNNTFDTVILTG